MRMIHTDQIISEIRDMCIDANLYLSDDMKQAISDGKHSEISAWQADFGAS